MLLKTYSLKTITACLLIAASLLTGCFSAKSLDKHVAKQYTDVNQPVKKKPVEGITISSPLVSNDYASMSQTTTKWKVPLLVYWAWDFKTTCTLNPNIPVKNFTTAVNNMANRGLKQKLNGRSLALSLEQVPNTFAILDKAHLVFLVYVFGWDIVTMKAEEKDMIVAYTITGNNGEAKSGTINIPYGNDQRALGMYQSWKKATNQYLEDYEANITRMSKQVVVQLMKEM